MVPDFALPHHQMQIKFILALVYFLLHIRSSDSHPQQLYQHQITFWWSNLMLWELPITFQGSSRPLEFPPSSHPVLDSDIFASCAPNTKLHCCYKLCINNTAIFPQITAFVVLWPFWYVCEHCSRHNDGIFLQIAALLSILYFPWWDLFTNHCTNVLIIYQCDDEDVYIKLRKWWWWWWWRWHQEMKCKK